MTSDIDLIANCWTIAGDFLPAPGRSACPIPLEERLAAAAEAGYTGVGFFHGDLIAYLDRGGSFRALRSRLDAHGIRHVELEYLTDWFADGERRQRSDAIRQDLYVAADALRARHIKVMPPFGNEGWSRQRLIDEYGELCAEAEDHNLLMPIEMIPFSDLPTLDAALSIPAGAEAANGGLLIDVWHVVRSGGCFEDIQRVPSRYLLAAEIDDADRVMRGEIREDTMHHRKFCGEGDFDVPAFIAAMTRAGYRGPYGVEILSDELRRLPLAEAARRSFRTARAQFR
ncbi:MAG: hypothetical protein CMLOHMNK_00553 [Steroidobacteraceae bacterium]|nr:hypothetical protein [Steroidobacteraceae bacterium]